MDYKIRKILEGEVSLLQDFLYEAIFVPEGMPAPPKSIFNQPKLQVYLTDFGKKKDDIGLVAEGKIPANGNISFDGESIFTKMNSQSIMFPGRTAEAYIPAARTGITRN